MPLNPELNPFLTPSPMHVHEGAMYQHPSPTNVALVTTTHELYQHLSLATVEGKSHPKAAALVSPEDVSGDTLKSWGHYRLVTGVEFCAFDSMGGTKMVMEAFVVDPFQFKRFLLNAYGYVHPYMPVPDFQIAMAKELANVMAAHDDLILTEKDLRTQYGMTWHMAMSMVYLLEEHGLKVHGAFLDKSLCLRWIH